MLGAVFFVLLSDAFVGRAKLHAQTMPHGQVPRAPGPRRLQQPDSVPGSDLCPLQDDDDTVKLYGASNGLNTCDDVVAGGQCSSYMRVCPLSCGICDGTANLTTLCHCFELGWSLESECRWDASTLLPYAKLQCGADWYDSRAADLATINSVMAGWDGAYTLSYGLSMGAYFTGDAAKFFRIFKEQHPMPGLLLISLGAEDFRNMGFSVREANDMFNGLDDFNFKSYRGAPVDTYATYDPPGPMWDSDPMGFKRRKVEQHPIEMSVSIVLEALNSLDEVNFAFEVQFLLVASWKDERINTVCNGAGASGHPIPATDRCAHYWTPQLPPVFPNQVSIDGNMAIEVLEDLGLFTVKGRYRKECNSPEVDCSSSINTSMAYRMMRLRGSFGAEMEFRRFPFDRQALEFIIRAPANMPRNVLVLRPKAKVDPSIFKQQNKSARQDPDGKDVIGGWRVVHMTAQERSLHSNTTTWDPDGFDTSDSRSPSEDPLFALMDSLVDPTSVNIPYYSNALSEASFVVHVCRIPSSYTFNFLILVTLLYAVALVSYLLSPADLDPRVNLSLTVILGVVFFQIMLSDLLPITGYLTDMHWFTFLSTAAIVMMAFSHVIIFAIFHRGERKRAVIHRVRKLSKSRRTAPAVIRVQRLARVYLARKYLLYLREEKELGTIHVEVAVERSSSSSSSSVAKDAAIIDTKAEKRRKKAAAAKAVARVMVGGRESKSLHFSQRVRRAIKKVDELIESFCVYCLDHTNWLVAIVFTGGYVIMMMSQFKDASWHTGAHICE